MEFNKLIPELVVSNLNKSLKFYVKILGFKVEYLFQKKIRFSFFSRKSNNDF